ncbi:Predicted arabinose efflux permease, MFS family [Oceanobacillus limi]|uniref:Predicted arabinose efflux permease, MFS family n=1 Tax=Oceanobacillus limi TaxID=930131 RepID=A0A1I0B095_9BACI|nr:MFS transporter [Oceanobacillus limi]SES99340.1 Predicted arabinose efflux permease, MFS family [Oceanobacillus limi]
MDEVFQKVKTAETTNYNFITFVMFWCALIVVSSVYVTTPLIIPFTNQFVVSQSLAAWTSSSFSLFYGIGFLLFGPLAERFGRKRIIAYGLASLTIITCMIGFIHSFWALVILRGIQGFIASTFAPTALAYVFDLFPKNKIATVVGFISFGYVTAGIFGQVVSDLINQTFDWQYVFILFSILYFLTFLCVQFGLPSTGKGIAHKGIEYYIHQAKVIFSQKNFIFCYTITIFLLMTFIGMYTVLGDYLGGAPFHLTDKEILYVRAIGIFGMILSPLAGSIVRKIGLMATLRLGLGISIIGLFLLGFGKHLMVIVSMSVLYVAGISLIFPAIMMVVGQLGGKQRALANSFYAFILFIGAMLGPLVAIGLMNLGSYLLTFGVLAILLAIALLVSFFIKI